MSCLVYLLLKVIAMWLKQKIRWFDRSLPPSFHIVSRHIIFTAWLISLDFRRIQKVTTCFVRIA